MELLPIRMLSRACKPHTLNEGNDCGCIRVDNMVATRIYGAAVSIESWKGGKCLKDAQEELYKLGGENTGTWGLLTGLEYLDVKFKEEPVIGFSLAGPDRIFYPAQAAIVSPDEILVSTENVPDPIEVRYAFDNYVEVNLYNSDGLPAHPFRTDSYKLTEP